MRYSMLLLVFVASFSSCKKEVRGCREGWDEASAMDAAVSLCDKTKIEAEAQYPHFGFIKRAKERPVIGLFKIALYLIG